jgi:hypothetical protein
LSLERSDYPDVAKKRCQRGTQDISAMHRFSKLIILES